MIAFRVQKSKYAASFWRASESGRWATPSAPLIYSCLDPATCFLEIMVHSETSPFSESFLIGEVEIGDDDVIKIEDFYDLPEEWKQQPDKTGDYHVGPRTLVGHWIHLETSLAISVPSVVISSSRNILINPAHPSFRDLVFRKPAELILDPRLES